MRRRVDLPEPLAPITPTRARSPTSRSTPSRTRRAPNDFVAPRNAIRVMGSILLTRGRRPQAAPPLWSAADQHVVATAGAAAVVPGATVQVVVAGAAEQEVRTGHAQDDVVTAGAVQDVGVRV